jgi:dihydroorotate dehydrogenase electron transfer subunit
VRLFTALVTANTRLREGVHLVEIHTPYLAQAVQPGQFCMVRCCHPTASDPLLRRPFFIHSVQREQGLCRLLIHIRGRGSAWLARQQEGMELDILGPLGHGWTLHPSAGNLLLISDVAVIASQTLLIQTAVEKELTVTLLCHCNRVEEAYPPSFLPPEVEYHIVTEHLQEKVAAFLSWADVVYCSVSQESAQTLYNRFERLRKKHFAQGILLRPLACGNGVCLTCNVETYTGQKLICRDGPVFDLQTLAR